LSLNEKTDIKNKQTETEFWSSVEQWIIKAAKRCGRFHWKKYQQICGIVSLICLLNWLECATVECVKHEIPQIVKGEINQSNLRT